MNGGIWWYLYGVMEGDVVVETRGIYSEMMEAGGGMMSLVGLIDMESLTARLNTSVIKILVQASVLCFQARSRGSDSRIQ